MTKIGIVFPHQLFEESVLISRCTTIYLLEEFLFFRQFSFHKQKIAFHRASMKFYESYLKTKKINVVYIDSFHQLADIRLLVPELKARGISSIEYIDPTDDWLQRRMNEACSINDMLVEKHENPSFFNSLVEIQDYFSSKTRLFQTDFYKFQRVKRQLLLSENQKPMGGKWSFDDENRLKYPKGKTPPKTELLNASFYYKEAIAYTNKWFENHPGQVSSSMCYPSTFQESKDWLNTFFYTRFSAFGAYEDAIVANNHFLHHSVITPMLNVGLLSPTFVLEEAIAFAEKHNVPLNSLEGFLRQIVGWREFVRAVYVLKGKEERTRNFWGFTRKIPACFWNGTTGIQPFDQTLKKVLETGYCHHIERLMVLGNFMLLCEFDPNEVYRWFMELFIDAYDWVMVPNVYGMSQFADGGLMATKPYLSGSNYVLKMSDYKKGSWQEVWDGLFWRFMHVHRDFFLQNPRLNLMVGIFDKMPKEKQEVHLNRATAFIDSLDEQLRNS